MYSGQRKGCHAFPAPAGSAANPLKYWLKFFQDSAFLPVIKCRRPANSILMSATDPVVLELAALKNLGEKTALWLVDAGVRSRSEMAKLGAIEVCKRMLLAGHPVSLVAAYAIEGALTDTHWNQIPPQKKLEVQRLFAVMKRGIAAGPPVTKAASRPAAKAAAEAKPASPDKAEEAKPAAKPAKPAAAKPASKTASKRS